MRGCGALGARASQAVVVECDRRKRRSGNPADLRSVRTSQDQAYSIVVVEQRAGASHDHCFASGAANTCLQASGNCASVIGGRGFGGSFGGFGWMIESLNQ